MDIREFTKENLRLIRIRNPWGPDGCWNGPFSDDSDEWDKHRNLRDELRLVFKSKKSDGTWWMAFNDWCVHFNKLFVCKVFPENWQVYSIESRWQGKTAGGGFLIIFIYAYLLLLSMSKKNGIRRARSHT